MKFELPLSMHLLEVLLEILSNTALHRSFCNLKPFIICWRDFVLFCFFVFLFFFLVKKKIVALVILYSTQFGFSQSIIKGTSWIGKCCLVIKQFLHLSYTWDSLFSRMANACVVFWIKVVLNFNFQPDQLLFLKFMSFSDSQTRNIHP